MEQYPCGHQQLAMVKSFQEDRYIGERAIDHVGYGFGNGQIGWSTDSPMTNSPYMSIEHGLNYSISESSSDGELMPSKVFSHWALKR